MERGLADSRTRAQALILGGKVRTGSGDGARIDRKAGDLVEPDLPIELAAEEPYVSRGGHKLAAALDAFGIDPAGLVCLDAGASTGGFTDVLLQRGRRGSTPWTSGRGQLADRIAPGSAGRDPRPHERAIADGGDGRRADRPRRRRRLVHLARPRARAGRLDAAPLPRPRPIVALVKPQFEVGKGGTDHGVVRDPAAHRAVLERVTAPAAAARSRDADVIASPILGPEGNREFLVDLAPGPGCADLAARIATVTGA